jgi:Domain of unknown function (DUF4249)
MKTFKTISMIIFISLFNSCENIDVLENSISYEELYVVSSQISGGDKNPEISFTKSLPLNEAFDIKKAEIKDVIAYIKTEKEGIFPLEYIKDGIYKPKFDLEIMPGEKYELFASIGEKKFFGSTIAPTIPKLHNIQLIDGHVECQILPEKDVVYSCIYVLKNNQWGNTNINIRERDFYSVEGPFEENSEAILIRTGAIPDDYLNYSDQYKLSVEIYAWDKSYKKYFETKNNNKPIDDVFSQGGGAIDWNISGENVIGMFIGFSTLVYTGEIK